MGGPRFAEVAVPIPVHQVFTYLVPERLREQIAIGQKVRISFGPRRMSGFVVGLPETSDVPKLKPLDGIIDPRPVVDAEMLALTQWIADQYLASWGEALQASVPAGIRKGKKRKTENRLYLSLSADEALAHAETLDRGRTASQAKALRALVECGGGITVAELTRKADVSRGPVETLVKKGVAELREEKVLTRLPGDGMETEAKPESLTDHQAAAMEVIDAALDRDAFRGILLHGVTGSGKTEVYLRSLERVVAAGKQAIVLVPEIALTPQTVRRFRGRFDRVAVLHSHLTEVERAGEWEDIRDGKVQVVVGARSAVFAPLPNPGLFIMDEEHEPTYKQQNSPRYHTREVLMERARRAGVPVIYGTATPSLEIAHRAKSDDFDVIQLPERVAGIPMPSVQVIDFREEKITHARQVMLSRQLEHAMRKTLGRGEQVFLFLNRRGFHSGMVCRQCGWIAMCSDCEVSLTVHRSDEKAVCHYCDRRYPIPEECPECKFEGIRKRGMGTERVTDLVETLFPDHKVVRMDSDAMKGKGDYEAALSAIGSGEASIVVGTQMIAKGLDFPNVTLVGIILADTPFAFPDFRAAERAFQLVVQMAGRSGRSHKGGHVIVQTMRSDHYALRTSARMDYLGFTEAELPERRMLGYPPYGTMVRVIGHGSGMPKVLKALNKLADEIRAAVPEGTRVTHAVEAPIPRIRNEDRGHFQVLGPDRPGILEAFRNTLRGRRKPAGVQLAVDVDPSYLQ